MQKVRSRSPLRLGLAGGGTDLKNYTNKFTGRVLNATINLYAHVTLDPLESKKKQIVFEAKDININQKIKISNLNKIKAKLPLHLETYKYIISKYNNNRHISHKLTTYVDVPFGSGLGSSSTLVVSMIEAYTSFLKIKLNKHQIAKDAFIIEREICRFDGGKQDQYAAAFGGINIFEFKQNSVKVKPLNLNQKIVQEFEESTILYYLGYSRKTNKIIADQNMKTLKSKTTLNAMHSMKRESYEFENNIKKGNYHSLFKSLERGWRHKVKTSKYISSNKISNIFNYAKKNGAEAGKISGAGGGGFMIFFTKPENSAKLKKKLNEYGGYVINCSFTFEGSQSWKI